MVQLLLQDTREKGGGCLLAEQAVYRHWCGVEGGTVLSDHSASLQGNIGYHVAKAKLIVFIDGSKNGNICGS
jgi:hypothetical protein